MAESVRDLVVSLSLESGSFSQNLKTINSQIREAESEFKAAGAGVSNFESTVAGSAAKSEMLAQKMQLQAQAVEQYKTALTGAQDSLNKNMEQHSSYAAALTQAKDKQAALAQAAGEAKTNYEAIAKALGEDSQEALNAKAAWEQLKQQQAEADAEVKKAQGQLEAVDKALRRNSDNVTSLQTGLNNAQAALSETTAEFQRVSSEAETAASGWTKAADALNEFGESVSSAGDKVTKAGTSLTKYLSVPIAALGTAAVASFNSVDEGYDTIIEKTGATGEALESMYEAMDNLYTTMNITAADAGTAIGEVATRFGLSGDTLEEVSRQFLEFAEINGTDVNDSIDSVSMLMKKFGVDAGEVSGVLGEITKVAQDTGINVATIYSGLDSNGAVLKEMGFSLEESVQLLAQMEINGVNATTAMTGFRKAVTESAKDGLDAREAINAQIEAIKNAKTETEALELAYELFGTKGAAEMTSAIRDGRINMDELSAVFSDYTEVVNETYEATQDLPDQAAIALNNLKLAGADLASTVMSALGPSVESLLKIVQKIVENFGKLNDSTKNTIVGVAALAAAVGPVLTVAGKAVKAVGSVSTALGTFAGSVASAGGGFSGFIKVIGSSPVAIGAAAVAVLALASYLIDVKNGTIAAKKELEKLADYAEDWKSGAAETFYSTAEGMNAFGLSAEKFEKEFASGADWMSQLCAEWADDAAETDETVSSYIDSFKTMTASTKSSLSELQQTAKDAGMTEMAAQMSADMEELDYMDGRIEQLLKKRQEEFLTDEDIAELNKLIEKKEEIEIRYNLVEGENAGFDELEQGIDNAVARAQAKGQQVGADVLESAMVAAAEGYAALQDSIDDEYDKRKQVVDLLDNEAELENGLTARQQAQEELDAWYLEQRADAAERYAEALGHAVDTEGTSLAAAIVSSENIQGTYDKLTDLYTQLSLYDGSADSLASINAIFEGMSESDLTELMAVMDQINSLNDAGLTDQEIGEKLGLDEGQVQMLTSAYDKLAGIQQILNAFNTDNQLDSLREMFGTEFANEVIKIDTDLNLDGAKARWAEFAENPGKLVETEAHVTDATGDGKTFEAKEITVNTEGKLTGVSGNGETFTASEYTVNVDGTLTAVTDSGEEIHVTGANVTVDGTMTGVYGDGETFTVSDCTVQTDGTLTGVTGDGETFTCEPGTYTVNTDGTLTGVTADGRSFTVEGADISVNAKVTLGNVSQAQIADWHRKNDGKVTITAPVNQPVQLQFGDDWETELQTLYENGLLEVYGENGLKLPVTPELLEQLDGSDLVIGLDEDGKYHVIVTPEWTETTPEEAAKAAEETGNWMNTVDAFLNGQGALDQMTAKYQTLIAFMRKNPITKWMFNSNLVFGNTKNSLESMIPEEDEIALAEEAAAIMKGLSEGAEIDEETLATYEKLAELTGYIVELDSEGYDTNQSYMNRLVQLANDLGYEVTATDLPELMRQLLIPESAYTEYSETLESYVAELEKINELEAQGPGVTEEETNSARLEALRQMSDLVDDIYDSYQGNEQYGLGPGEIKALETYRDKIIELGGQEELGDMLAKINELIGTETDSLYAAGEQAGGQLDAGLANGIAASADLAVQAAYGAASRITTAMMDAFVIHSPSRLWRDEIGLNLMRGLGEGVTQGAKEQQKVIANAAGYLTGAAGEAAFGGSSTYTYNTDASLSFAGANFTIRSQEDVYALANEIAVLQRRYQRGKGTR